MSDSTAPVTLVMPCLNSESTLAEALESVFAQTTPPIEVLLIDDGSQDNSVHIAKSFGPRVRVLRNQKGNTGGARSLGSAEAAGTFVTFCDSDDTIEPTKIEKQVTLLEQRPPKTIVHTGSLLFWDDDSHEDYVRTNGELAQGRCMQVIFERNPVCGASVMARKSTILELGNYNPELKGTDDFGLSLIASTCCDFEFISEPLYRMRRHANNMTNRKARMAYYHWLAQERFRQRCPEAFNTLPRESIEQFMIEPVIRTVHAAYWAREPSGYRTLLKLARQLKPDDERIRLQYRRRLIPMRMLRAVDRLRTLPFGTAAERT